jgi:hypothetical protein
MEPAYTAAAGHGGQKQSIGGCALDAESAIRELLAILVRPNVNPVIKAERLKQLLQPPFSLSLDQIGRRALRFEEEQAINRTAKVVRQPSEILDLLRDGQLSEGHAVFLDDVPNVAKRIRMARKAVRQRWDLAKTCKAVRLEVDPKRKEEIVRGFAREGFALSWDGDEVELNLRNFYPQCETLDRYLRGLKVALEFVLDDNDRELGFSENDDEPPLRSVPESARKYAAAEVVGVVLQLPMKPSHKS